MTAIKLHGERHRSNNPEDERNNVDGAPGLQHELGPEVQALPKVQKHREHRRTAWHEITLVPAGEVSSGVELQQWIAVP